MNYLILVLAGVLSGGIVFGGKILALMGASPFEIMLYPSLIGSLVILPFAFKNLYRLRQIPLSANLLLMFAISTQVIGQYAPLFMNISVTLVLLLVYLQPVWTTLIEHFYFHKEVSKLHWLMILCLLVGLVLLIKPWGRIEFNVWGVIMALMAGLGLSLWIVITRFFTQKGITPSVSFWCTCAYPLLPILAVYFGADEFMHNRSLLNLNFAIGWKLWQSFVVYLLFVYLPANILVFFGNKDISAAVIGTILLLEPVTGISLDVVFLHFPLSWNVIAGGIVILVSNIIIIVTKDGTATKRKP